MVKGIRVVTPGLIDPCPRVCLVCGKVRPMTQPPTLAICRRCHAVIRDEQGDGQSWEDATASIERLGEGDIVVIRCRATDDNIATITDQLDRVGWLGRVLILDHALDVTVRHGVMRIEGDI